MDNIVATNDYDAIIVGGGHVRRFGIATENHS
jgi:hypothetical protein